MSPPRLPQPLRGIVPPMVTPLTKGETLDATGVERLIEHILAGGVSGVFVLGTSGEGPALGFEVCKELIGLVVERVGGRVPVLVGISHSSMAESLALAQVACDAGAQAVVATPPYYYPLSQADLARYYERLAARSPLPLFLYNMPSHTKVGIELDTVRRLIDVPQIVGLKDSSANMIYFHHLLRLRRTRPDWTVLMGPEELLAASVLFGGDGGVCGGANLLPRLYTELFDAACRAELAKIRSLQDEVLQLAEVVYAIAGHGAAVTAGLKYALACLGIVADTLAQPFAPPPADSCQRIRRWLEQAASRWLAPIPALRD